MAKNWTMAEAMKVISAADLNSEEIADLYRRFPNVARLMTAIASGDTMAAKMLIGFLPEWATVGKIEKVIKAAGEADNGSEDDTDGNEDSSEEIEEEAPKPKKRGSKKVKEEESVEEEEFDEDSDVTDYESMKPQELFKICKEKGIRVMAKKDSKYYARKLKEFEEAQSAEDDSDDDWSDDEVEETPKPKKKADKAPAEKPAKKAKKVEDDEDEEDWDI